MRWVEVWTVYEEHLVFNDVILAGPSKGEKFFCIRREDRTDYILAYDIKRVQVMDDGAERKYKSDYAPKKKKPIISRSKQAT